MTVIYLLIPYERISRLIDYCLFKGAFTTSEVNEASNGRFIYN
jgi:hypothetical protein